MSSEIATESTASEEATTQKPPSTTAAAAAASSSSSVIELCAGGELFDRIVQKGALQRERLLNKREAKRIGCVGLSFNPLRDFAKDSVRLVKRCNKPDRKEFSMVAVRTAIGFVVMGFIGFFVKLILIPVNNIIVGSA